MSKAWMPLYVADYLADTGHLNAAEHGGYLLLIMHYWQKGGLPNDDKLLARICRMTPEQWAEAKPVLSDLFEDGWRHKRIDAELAKNKELSDKRRAAALQKQSNSTPIAEQKPTQSQSHSQEDTALTGGRDLDGLSRRLCEAAGISDETASPGLLAVSEPLNWLRSGCDLEADVLPTLKAVAAKRRGKPPGSWAYFSAAVFEARDRRLAPAPAVVARGQSPPRHRNQDMIEAFARIAQAK